MVEPTANFLLATVRDLLIEEVKFLSNVKSDVEKVEEDLTTIHALLKDADANKKQADSAAFQNFIHRLKKLAIDAENVLETYAVEVESKKEGKGLKKKLQRYMGIVCDCYNAHKVGNEIEVIRSRLADLTAEQRSIASGGDGSSVSADQEHRLRLRYAHEVDRYFVGMKKDIDSLVSMMKDDSPHSPSVISICGMGGLGKTTLARKIYHHQDVRGHFGSRAWVCLTQQFHSESILREIFTQIDAHKAKEAQTFDALMRGLYEVLVQRKCLIVMDDIWEDDHWKMIEPAFPKKNCKVVLTTRSKNVASRYLERHLHELGFQSEAEGWELLGKIALPVNDDGTNVAVESTLEDIGRQIVRKCGGLPLAISVVGGILRQKKLILAEWKEVSNHMDEKLKRGEGTSEYKEVKQILDLSYDVLPYYLKPCFLYLSCFLEDKEIDSEQLYLLWMAEGLISSEEKENSKSLRDVAERYLAELALRCMVQVERRGPMMGSKKFASCRVHDLMRELCSSRAEKEKFMKRFDISIHQHHTPPSLRAYIHRLAINVVDDEVETVGTYNLQEVKNLRSLLAFTKGSKMTSFDIRNYLENSKHLRILVVCGFDLEENLQLKIGKLPIHLRHLSLFESYIEELPREVYKLPFLQTLDLRVSSEFRIPNVIWKMKRLRHLFLHDEIEVIGGGKLRVDGLNELETLEGISGETACFEDIIKLKNLGRLYAVLKGEEGVVLENVDCINGCDALRETRLDLRGCGLPSFLLRKVIMIRSLFSLEILGCKFDGRCIFPSYTQGQGMYQNLVQLRIEEVWDGEDRLKEMIFCANSFPELKILHLRNLMNLCEWEVERGAMPKLRELIIVSCKYLERLPDEVLSISTLEELRFIYMSQQFKNHARQAKHILPNLTVFEIGSVSPM